MRNSPPSVTYGNGAVIYAQALFAGQVSAPYLNGYNVILDGTSAAGGPVVYINNQVINTLNNITVDGSSATAMAYGGLIVYPPDSPALTITHGIDLSFGNLTTGSAVGGSGTLDGNSIVTNHSVLTAIGGRYFAAPLVLNGHMSVSNGSTANFSLLPLQGAGTLEIDAGGTVDVTRVVAGLHLDVDRGGTLVVGSYGSPALGFLGTINEAPGGVVDVLSAPGAVSEIFHRSTGTLDLLNRTGANVAELRFAGASTLYATADGGGGMDITTAHHIGSLPTIFVH
jgi:hypothetical protein